MPFRRLYQSLLCARAALYYSLGSPSFGITWSLVTFFSGLLCLIYDHKRRDPELQRKKRVPELE